MNIINDTITLKMPLKRQYLKMAVDFSANSAACYGYDEKVRNSIELSTEELFLYLCNNVSNDEMLEIKCWNGISYVGIDFTFKANNLNFKNFNLTASVLCNNEENFEEISLFLIARTVDKLKISVEKDGSTKLTIIKEKKYIEINEPLIESSLKLDHGCNYNLKFSAPAIGEIKIYCGMIYQNYKNFITPDFLKYPGKVSDMLASGELHAISASYENGALAGIILWRNNDKTSKFYGPYVFPDKKSAAVSELIINEYIETISKTGLKGVYCHQSLNNFPGWFFEKIGGVKVFKNGIEKPEKKYYYRQLKEDAGTFSWCHESLKLFMGAEYKKFHLPRELRLIKDFGETKTNLNSVISCEVKSNSESATLRPLLAGSDIAENISAHINLLKNSNIENILFEIDTGIQYHCNFVPAVLKNGFIPKFIIAYGGNTDLIVFQKEPKFD